MAQLNFDASTIDTTSHDPIKSGTYDAVITDSEIKANRANTGKGLNLTFEILSEGAAKGRKVWAWINFQHQNQDAQRIGQEELARVCKAVGVSQLTDSEQLHNIPLMITVDVDRNDATRNVIKAYKAKEGASGAAAVAGGTATLPANGSATGAAPWAR